MLYRNLLLAVALSAGFFDLATAIPQRGNNKGNNNQVNGNNNKQQGGANAGNAGNAGNDTAVAAAADTGNQGTATTGGKEAGGDTTLDPAVIQTGSASDGNANAEKGQSASAT